MNITNNIYLYEQQNIPNELFNSVTKSIKKAISSYQEELLLKEIETRTSILLDNIYSATTEVISFRDMLEGYYINDPIVDEKILNSFFYYFEEKKDNIENLLDNEEYKKLPEFICDKLQNALENLYSELVNVSFDMSLKIGESYIGSESHYNLLQKA